MFHVFVRCLCVTACFKTNFLCSKLVAICVLCYFIRICTEQTSYILELLPVLHLAKEHLIGSRCEIMEFFLTGHGIISNGFPNVSGSHPLHCLCKWLPQPNVILVWIMSLLCIDLFRCFGRTTNALPMFSDCVTGFLHL